MSAAKEKATIALDAMGGDNAPSSVLAGANHIIKQYPNIDYLLFGDADILQSKLANYPKLVKRAKIIHTDSAIAADEKPSIALRKGKNSSMRLAIDAVKDGRAAAMVSAGNTGALMAMAKLVLRTLPEIDRPAIASIFPTRKGKCVLLDLGANVDCNADNLVQFAIMGDAFAKVLLDIDSPSVALLNVGEEDTKGSEVVKSAAEEIREGEYAINFSGYIEGDGIAEGVADVVVTDGFTGNIALKTAEGTAKICGDYIKKALRASPFALLGGLLARRSLKKMFKQMDPRYYNGAMFVGLNGIAVKSHGGTDHIGFGNAIAVAIDLALNDINQKIGKQLSIESDSSTDSYAQLESEVDQEHYFEA